MTTSHEFVNGRRRPGTPRVIRRVIKFDRRQLPKVARDRKAHVTMEKITAHKEHVCHSDPHCGSLIESGQPYAAVGMPGWGRNIGYRRFPETKTFHLNTECVPPEAKRLVRFLT